MANRKKSARAMGMKTDEDEDTIPGTRSIVRTCEILHLLAQAKESLTVTEVGHALAMPKSTAHRYLSVLESQQFAERDNRNRYRIGLGMLSLQSRYVDLLVQNARPLMAALRDRFDETVNLAVLSRNRIVYLDVLESTRNIRHSVEKGDEDMLHSTALGKAIAASLSEREVLELLIKTGMERKTANTITDPTAFLNSLKEIREKGYALDDRENEEEARCVAVLIPGLSMPAAISISGVASRFPLSDVEEVAEALKETAARLGSQEGNEISSGNDLSASGSQAKSSTQSRKARRKKKASTR